MEAFKNSDLFFTKNKYKINILYVLNFKETQINQYIKMSKKKSHTIAFEI